MHLKFRLLATATPALPNEINQGGNQGRSASWAEAKPWSHEGGLCVIRTESTDVADLVIPSVRRAVHGANSGEARLDVRRLEVGGEAGTPTQALVFVISELHPAISPFEARDKIRACLLDRSFVLVFVEVAPVDINDWEGIVGLLEYSPQVHKPGPLVCCSDR